MAPKAPSQRVRELIRAAARAALESNEEWLDELDRATVAANPDIADDPALATIVSRANRANLRHFAAANLRNPGDPVAPNLSPETLRMARDLVRLGHDVSTLDIYRTGHNVAWQRWNDIAFGLSSNPQELRELLDVSFRLAKDFIDSTLAGIDAKMRSEYDELTRNIQAERRKLVEHLLDGGPVSLDSAEARLGYRLNRPHTAAVIWSDRPDDDPSCLDEAASAFGDAVGRRDPLIVVASAPTRWVWVKGIRALDTDRIHGTLANAPHVRVAIGSTADGLEGFRRSHLEALATQRILSQSLRSERVASYSDIEMIALLTENPDGADNFIESTLGAFEDAGPELHNTVLTFINEQCNTSQAANRLFIHRNTLTNRLETAQRLLPRPLAETTIRVAVALEALRWRAQETSHSGNSDEPRAD
ncbi:PucR family transcriptional regulator [Mycobacterium spongiae]|uniref:PucR family transcriptional regulator n=1 Tax=Mycobacterium spongiae TaxID=886343 RepID=A0A975PWV4_9MYCO|nr:PucR family transcriptional regulator [Mycobacterium spongiae]QUR67154.1 PucR family transcriptional regulator [Mycobacterium spongiae]